MCGYLHTTLIIMHFLCPKKKNKNKTIQWKKFAVQEFNFNLTYFLSQNNNLKFYCNFIHPLLLHKQYYYEVTECCLPFSSVKFHKRKNVKIRKSNPFVFFHLAKHIREFLLTREIASSHVSSKFLRKQKESPDSIRTEYWLFLDMHLFGSF